MTAAPTLTTERLTLRPHLMADFPPYAAVMTSERAVYMGGPYSATEAWGWFASDVAQWDLLGHGGLAVIETATGKTVGQVSVIQPPDYPEPELGWIAFAGHEGKGYITEAASRLRDHAWSGIGVGSLVSYIDSRNDRSIAVARRLGAIEDPQAPRTDYADLVYRHPAPETLQ
ncbi:GNAT family N-acetyltransferase [Rhodovulum sp. YNF3179]|uniref:GNAT family N-acetyltransferase n=1 Tax=Rhodovulum sp. YNF3179 TaxID=3425127 RepID=UPI003D3420BD